MKNLRILMLSACMMLCSLLTIAQEQKIPVNDPDYNRPKLFNNLPEKIPFNPETFFNLQNKQAGSSISISLSEETSIPFEGILVSSAEQFEGKMRSVVIRSTNYSGATFSMSKLINENGNITYTGRWISFKHGDIYVLQQSEGHYILVKKNFYDLVNE